MFETRAHRGKLRRGLRESCGRVGVLAVLSHVRGENVPRKRL